jgi:hypothetical protein
MGGAYGNDDGEGPGTPVVIRKRKRKQDHEPDPAADWFRVSTLGKVLVVALKVLVILAAIATAAFLIWVVMTNDGK